MKRPRFSLAYAALLPMLVTVLVGYVGSAGWTWGCR
jgi:hypothetical protein